MSLDISVTPPLYAWYSSVFIYVSSIQIQPHPFFFVRKKTQSNYYITCLSNSFCVMSPPLRTVVALYPLHFHPLWPLCPTLASFWPPLLSFFFFFPFPNHLLIYLYSIPRSVFIPPNASLASWYNALSILQREPLLAAHVQPLAWILNSSNTSLCVTHGHTHTGKKPHPNQTQHLQNSRKQKQVCIQALAGTHTQVNIRTVAHTHDITAKHLLVHL